MQSRWSESEAKKYNHSDLALRVYTSRLLGADSHLVLHGGGNTSVKSKVKNIFGEDCQVLYVKGSGWDLKTIEEPGFAACQLDVLLKLSKLETLSDTDMVRELKLSMMDPSSPTPSIETILHALIPFKFVDHTHADAVVTISNTPGGEERLKEIYGEKVLLLPYTMPGFVLAQQIYQATKDLDLSTYEGIILLGHGVFTFDDDGKKSYEKMISLVDRAEEYLKANNAYSIESQKSTTPLSALEVARVRELCSQRMRAPMIVRVKDDEASVGYSGLKNIENVANQGPLTPDHVIQTKRTPAFLDTDLQRDLERYFQDYRQYFEKNNTQNLTMLDPVPRYAIVKKRGILAIGPNVKRASIVSDIVDHTLTGIQHAQKLGGWRALPEKDIFDIEYWELEQAKLKKAGSKPAFEGRVAVVTGAFSGIGRACVEKLNQEGACVLALDINPEVTTLSNTQTLGVVCDVTQTESINQALNSGVAQFGGVDILVSNAGVFPASQKVDELSDELWQKSLDLNLTSHMKMIRACTPFLKRGWNPNVVIVASKNVPAPGPGASAYSAAKAGLTQLGRVAALELGNYGIRVNMLHPNQVFDTAIWTDEVLKKRAENYQLTVEEYKKNNLLKTEITSHHVANLAIELCGSSFSKTTGAQIPIDGGNERVI